MHKQTQEVGQEIDAGVACFRSEAVQPVALLISGSNEVPV